MLRIEQLSLFLSVMISRLIHIVLEWILYSFQDSMMSHCMATPNCAISASVGGNLSGFQILVSLNMAAMLIWVHGFIDSYIFIPFEPKAINRESTT